MNKCFYIICLLACFAGISSAQIKIDFILIDDESSKKLTEYETFDLAKGKSYIPDSNSVVSILSESGNSIDLVFFSFQYESQSNNYTLSKDSLIEIRMKPLSTTLNHVVVSAKREELFALKRFSDVEGTSIFASRKTERIMMQDMVANLAVNNPRQLFSRVAGINAYESSDGGLQLNIGSRGLDPNRTSNFNTRQNGYDISADVLGYPESYYTPPSEAIEEIHIIRGAASLQYGSQFGGLVNFKLKHLPEYSDLEIITRQTFGSFGLFNSFNSVGFRAGKTSFYGVLNYKSGSGYRANSEYESKYAFASFRHQLSKKVSIGLESTYYNYIAQQAGGLTDSQFESNPKLSVRSRNWFLVDWKLMALTFDYKPSPKTSFSTKLYHLDAQRKAVGFRGSPLDPNSNPITELDERNSNGEYITPRDLIIGEFNNFGIESRFLQNYKFGNQNHLKNSLLLGFKYYQSNNSSVQGPGSLGISDDFNFANSDFPDYPNQSSFKFPNRNLAIFNENIYRLTQNISFTAGLRYEFIKTQSEGNYTKIAFDNAGNALETEDLNDNRTLRRSFLLYGIGLSYKTSVTSEIYTNFSKNYRSVTFNDIRVVNPGFIIDPGIMDESGYTIDLSYRGRHNNYLSWELGTFYVIYKDRIGIVFDDRANRVRKNIGRAEIAGIESLFQFNIRKLYLPNHSNLKLDFFSNLVFTKAEYTKSEEVNVVGKQVEFVPEYNLKLGFNIGYKNFILSSQLTHLSRQFTDVQNSEKAISGDSREGIIGPIPSYTVADISMKFIYKSFTIEAGVNNLLGENYFTQRATGYPGPGIIPSFPRNYYLTLGWRLIKRRQ